jgi:5-bromo-4-chloroindolyl phosphate hydrolysis protein
MGNAGKWGQIGEDVMDSVFRAVETGNFEGLSKNVGNAIGEASRFIGDGMDQFGRGMSSGGGMGGMRGPGGPGMRGPGMNAMGGPGPRHRHQDSMTPFLLGALLSSVIGNLFGAGGGQAGRTYETPSQSEQRGSWSQTRTDTQTGTGTVTWSNPGSTAVRRYRRSLPGQVAGPLCLGLGIAGACIFGMAAFGGLLAALAGFSLIAVLILLVITVAFVMLAVCGGRITARNSRFRKYVRVIGSQSYCQVERLAAAIGKHVDYVQRDLTDMLRRGYFPEGHLDEGATTLMLDQETYSQYQATVREQARREAKEAKEKASQQYSDEVKQILEEGEDYIRHIHECNDAIPGEVMSEKLAKLESIMIRIFDQVKKQPESADDLRKFMTYYLPTTTKLVDAYRDLDGQPEYGTNVANTKKEIEDTLDTINEAFENLFDSLFENTAWDISSDISTMKVMLQQEGLTGNKDFKANKQQEE